MNKHLTANVRLCEMATFDGDFLWFRKKMYFCRPNNT